LGFKVGGKKLERETFSRDTDAETLVNVERIVSETLVLFFFFDAFLLIINSSAVDFGNWPSFVCSLVEHDYWVVFAFAVGGVCCCWLIKCAKFAAEMISWLHGAYEQCC